MLRCLRKWLEVWLKTQEKTLRQPKKKLEVTQITECNDLIKAI